MRAINVLRSARSGPAADQGCSFVERERYEAVAQGVGVEVGRADLFAHPFDQLAGLPAGQALTGGGDEQRSFGARALGSVDGVRDGRVQRRDGSLRGLALAASWYACSTRHRPASQASHAYRLATSRKTPNTRPSSSWGGPTRARRPSRSANRPARRPP